MYIFYLDLVIGISNLLTLDFFKLITYVLFFGIVVHYYGLPLHIIRDLYMTLRSFLGRVRDLIQYRRATANMNQKYPTATIAELTATDRTCIICREEMLESLAAENLDAAQIAGAGDPNTPKRLPCGMGPVTLFCRTYIPYALFEELARETTKLSDL